MRKAGYISMLVAVILALVLAFFVWWPLRGVRAVGPRAPIVSIKFVGYATNGNTGSRLARFAVSNMDNGPVLRSSHFVVEMLTSTGGEPLEHGFLAGGKVLAAGGGETITIPAPTNSLPWKVSILFYNDEGHTAVTKWEKGMTLFHAIENPNKQIMWYMISSGQVDGP